MRFEAAVLLGAMAGSLLAAGVAAGHRPVRQLGVSVPPPPAAVAVVAPPTAAPPTEAPTPTPAPTAAPVASSGGGGGAAPGGYRTPAAPRPPAPNPYPVVFSFDAGSVGVHLDVASTGVNRQGAMDTPEGPLSSVYWHEAFWLRSGTTPGNVGTATIAGHLDDTAGRPAAFWNIRNLHTGAEVAVTRRSDGVLVRYRITEIDVLTIQQASQKSWLERIYGSGTETQPLLTLITCTGRFVHGEYDHRFIAFAQMVG